ncbi:MAG: hypothetical protein ABI559_12825 [Chloroflexota bacterium]
MRLSRGIAWLAVFWAIASAFDLLYLAAAWNWWIFGPATAAIGLATVCAAVWAFFRGWGLIAIPLSLPPLLVIAAGLNPGFVFLPAWLFLVTAGIVRIFEIQAAKLRAHGGHA